MNKKGERIMGALKILLSALFCLIFITGCSSNSAGGDNTPNFTVTFNSHGGSQHASVTQTEGAAITLPTPTRTGFLFEGWFSAATGGTKFGDGGSSYTVSGNVTMHAQWKPAIFFVTSNEVCADCSLPSIWYLVVAIGDTITLPRARSEIGGTFSGWYSAASGGTRHGGAGDNFTVTTGLVMYARFL
jgi:uncharacterized repeat protein (TIGR02543 family)